MKKSWLASLIILLSFSASAGDIAPFQIYKENGKKSSFKKMMKALKKSQLILFGEIHNSAICHWLQFETSEKLLEQNADLVFGAEMFEADNQVALNAYLAGHEDEEGLDSLARLWSNYLTDYAPLVDLAKQGKRPFIATNIPRRYASMVYKNGFDILLGLSDSEKEWIAPLPIAYDPELPGYVAMLEMMGGHGGENFPKAQAIKDATMGFFISNVLDNGDSMIHFNGAYHSNNFEGILYYVLLNHPELIFTTISTVIQESIDELQEENKGLANFIICVDENMTPTY